MKNTVTIHADMNEILFADRNQEYGAYQIRKAYPNTILNAFYITASTAIGLVLLLFFLQRRPVSNSIPLDEGKYILHDVTLPIAKPPVDPKTPKVVPLKLDKGPKTQKNKKGMNTVETHKIKLTPDADPAATITADSLFKDKQAGEVTTDSSDSQFIGGDPNGTGEEVPMVDKPCKDCPPGDGKEKVAVEPSPFKPHLGEMPVPMNLNDIRRAIGYPAAAREGNLEGKIVYRVLVDAKGNYVRHLVVHSSNPIFDKACKKHLKKLTFQPGMMGDQAVPVWVVLPFKFTLMR